MLSWEFLKLSSIFLDYWSGCFHPDCLLPHQRRELLKTKQNRGDLWNSEWLSHLWLKGSEFSSLYFYFTSLILINSRTHHLTALKLQCWLKDNFSKDNLKTVRKIITHRKERRKTIPLEIEFSILYQSCFCFQERNFRKRNVFKVNFLNTLEHIRSDVKFKQFINAV